MSANPMTEVKFVPLVYVLSNAGVDLDIADFHDVTALQLSIRYGLLEVMTSLLKCGAEVRGHEEKLAERHCQLFVAEFVSVLRKLSPGYWHLVQQNKTFAVNVLVKSWCRINVSRQGQSLIEFARQTPDVDPKLLKHLVDNEASIEVAHAVMAGDGQRVQFLLCNQAVDLHTSDLSHKENFFQPFHPLTLYGAALKYGHKHLLPLLRKDAIYRPSKADDTMKASSDDRQRHQSHDSGFSTSAVCVVL
ncbi:hypothetical protein C0Q70_10466 [Pomacea canaliculata]|uniref:Uncharacterized protein n=2 Tax=Pomacea canaliculata TaxID=400727 RepID=A0A2T7P3A0_POMCA|nr:hypothetical protein C0Q70_10466 [Pomacea canaliculata]